MATLPSGYHYYDASANKKYTTAGATLPSAEVGDELIPTASSNNFWYTLKAAHTKTCTWDDDTLPSDARTVSVPIGWVVEDTDPSCTRTTMLSSFNGYNVVEVYINRSTFSQMTLPSQVVFFSIPNNTTITQINGSIPSSLAYFYCYNCTALKTVPSLANATKILNGIGMFYNCNKLTTISVLPPNAVSFHCAFYNCTSLETAPAIPSKVIYGGKMFYGCTKLTQTPVNNSTVISRMFEMFSGCSSLTTAENFNIPSTLLYGYSMFSNCSKLVVPPSTVRGTDANIYKMFEGCTLLATAPKFEGTYTQMNTIFWKCVSLRTPPIIPNGSQSMAWAFAECSSLETVPYIPSTVTNLYYCFYKCTALTWVSMRLNNVYGCSYNYMFAGCTNLTGIIYLGGTYVPPCNHMFYDTTKTIIIGGDQTCANAVVAQQNNNNVYRWLNTSYTNISSVRTDINGIPDDTGEYMQLSIDFTCPVVDYSKLYVPKIYIKNNQIAPSQNWILTYINEQETKIVKEIKNSTDIEAARIEANNVVASGNFTAIFSANNLSDGGALTIYIPTSNSQVATGWNDSNHQYVMGTFYWNGTLGSAIFTGDTYIWDALPDGSSFKIGGAIIEDAGETGFIVGNEIASEADQYPSRFNGPVTFNSNIYIAIDENASSEYLDGRIYDRINILNWNDVLG